jgi:serine/threonine-protein kinase ATR
VELLKATIADPTLVKIGEILKRLRLGDSQLQREFAALQPVTLAHRDPPHPPSKRRRISIEPTMLNPLLSRLSALLNVESADSFSDLDSKFLYVYWIPRAVGCADGLRDDFEMLSDRERCAGIDLLAYIPCASDNTLRGLAGEEASTFCCSFCKNGGSKDRPSCLDLMAKSQATTCFARLIRLPSFAETKRPRIIAMIALRRLVFHSVDPDFLDLETSPAGQWCLQCLRSSVRELRIAAR